MTQAPIPVPVKKPRGFLFYAAIVAGVMFAFTALGAGACVLYARSLVIAHTSPSAVPLRPVPEKTDADFEALSKRVEAFQASVRDGGPVPELVLSADDINALIARKSDPKTRLGDMLRVTLEDGKIGGELSAPLDKVGLPLPGGRWLNAAGAFNVSMKGGVLIITADTLVLDGKPVSPALLARLKNENLARNVYKDPKHAEALRKIDSIEIKGGLMTIKPAKA